MLSPRERVLYALSHKKLDRAPFEFGLTPTKYEEFKRRTGAKDPQEYFEMDV